MRLKSLFLHCSIAAFLAAGTTVRAQSLEPFNPYGVFSPSVEAWQMTRCGNLLPSLYTGTMTFSLPLMTYSDPDFTIPVTLEYSFDGYKPGQHSGSVGYGWYLNCGGVITREVRGIPDEGDPNQRDNSECRVHGWRQAGSFRDSIEVHSDNIFSVQRRSLDRIPVSQCHGMLESYDPFSDTPMYASRNSQGYYELYDTAPDIYHFRFLGHSGDFLMLPDGAVRVFNSDIPHGELSVAFTDNENAPWTTVITLTTGDGYQYRFDCRDISETPDCHENSPVHVSMSVSSYHLTRITAPNLRTVSFSYTQHLNPAVTPRYGAHLDGRCMSRDTMDEEYDHVFSTDGDAFKWIFVREATHLLDKVTIDKVAGDATADSLVFRYATAASDENLRSYYEQADESCFESLDPAKRLTSVSMYGQHGLADSASLTYQNASHGTPKSFLHSVTGMKTGIHSFGYYLPTLNLPPNDTQNTDHWGYWNGSSISDLREHLVETAGQSGPGIPVPEGHSDSTYVVVLPDTTIVRRCAADLYDQMTDDVKEANPVFARCGGLIQIQYPHGGKTCIEYEPNRVTRRMNVRSTETVRHLEPVDTLDAAATWTVGGVRVASLIDTDGHGRSDTTRFSYTDPDANGRESGILMVMPKYAEVASYEHRANAKDDIHNRIAVAYVNAIGFNNCCGFVLDRDPHVVYPAVTVTHPDASSTEHRFTSVADPGLSDYYAVLTGLPKHVYCLADWFEGYTRIPTCMIPASVDRKNMRGQPKRTVVRNAGGQELSRTEYNYSSDLVTVPSLAFNNILTFNVASSQALSPVLISTTETDHGLTTRTNHTYNALGQVKTTSTTGGTAGCDTLRTTLRYRHETGDTSPYRTLLEAAAKTRVCEGGSEYLLAREQYAYKSGTPKVSGITSFLPDSPVPVTATHTPFSVDAGSGRISSFEYNGLQRLTQALFPGCGSILYTWNGNMLVSKSENGTPNVSLFDWKDLVGLTQVESPSGQSESYLYDDRNRPWKTLDSDFRPVSVFHYKLRNQ